MNNSENLNLDLNELLCNCTDRHSANWQQSWNEFFVRYKNFIYQIALKRCRKWSVTRMQNQLSDEINDIVYLVIKTLIDNDFKVLKDYKTRDNNTLFLTYLATITDRITKRYLQQNFKSSVFQLDLNVLPKYDSKTNIEDIWELYDEWVYYLRSVSKKTNAKSERNIHLYLMYTWNEKSDIIKYHPFYKPIGADTLYALKNRIKDKFKKKFKDF